MLVSSAHTAHADGASAKSYSAPSTKQYNVFFGLYSLAMDFELYSLASVHFL